MSGIKPEQLDYPGMVRKMDQQGFDWHSLLESTQDPGFANLERDQQRHIIDLLTVKSSQEAGQPVDPYAKTGKLGALRTIGTFLKSLAPAVGGPGMGGQAGGGTANIGRGLNQMEEGVKDLVSQGMLMDQAREVNATDLQEAGEDIVQSFAHYFTGGLVSAPKSSKDPYVNEAMESVKSVTGLAAIGTQLAIGSGLLGWVSKVPLLSSRAANLSAATRGLIKGAILDFGINAAWPEGLPKENRLGLSDDIARAIAPESVLKDPTSLAGRAVSGVGGAVEGALLGSLLFGFGHGVKLADSKYAFSITSKQVEKMKASLESIGIDASAMSKKDMWLTYRTNMTKHVQDISEAAFNGERMSAEAWIAQAFLADPNVTELTSAEGRMLWGVFSNNKGGVSVIKGINNPDQALEKLRRVGINVEATVIPRRVNSESRAVSGATRRVSVETDIPTVSAEELDRAVELDPALYSAKIAPSGHIAVEAAPEPGSVAGGMMGKTPEEMERILHPSKGLPEGVSAPAQRESAGTLAQEELDRSVVNELVGEPTAPPPDGPPVATTAEVVVPNDPGTVVHEHAPSVSDEVMENEFHPPPPNSLFPNVWDKLSMAERQSLLGVGKESKSLASRKYTDLPEATRRYVFREFMARWRSKGP